MTYNYEGYGLKFIQKRFCKDGSDHLFSLVFKFYSPVTKLWYILIADYHNGDVFAVKFYAKMHRKSDFKYSKIINKGDLGNILITCLKIIPLLMKDYPNASFGFIGSRTYDKVSKKLENYKRTQRFNIYRDLVQKKIGTKTFEHFEYEEISGYLLINRNNGVSILHKEALLKTMFANTYTNLLDVN